MNNKITSKLDEKLSIVFIVLLIVTFSALSILCYKALDERDNYKYYSERDEYLAEYQENKYNELIENISATHPLIITDIEIANGYKGGKIETDYGERIYSSHSMYLVPRISYYGVTKKDIDLNVKLIYPSGTISTGETSPSGYTFTDECSISTGSNSERLKGWGNSTRGNWESGTYRIEIWYNDNILASKTFKIY